MRETRHDVVVIGGGPVGMMTGIQLGMLGLEVAIFERWPSRYPDPRACGIHHDAVRVIQSAGLGEAVKPVLEPVIGEDRAYIFRNGEEEILLEIAWNLPGDSGWPQMSTYYQPDLEDLFEQRIEALPNVTFDRGWEAVAVSQDEDSATVELRATAGGPGDGTWTASADWMIGADGANSLVRRTMGATGTDLEFAHDWLVVDTIPHEEGHWWPYLEQRCDPAPADHLRPLRPGRSAPLGVHAAAGRDQGGAEHVGGRLAAASRLGDRPRERRAGPPRRLHLQRRLVRPLAPAPDDPGRRRRPT